MGPDNSLLLRRRVIGTMIMIGITLIVGAPLCLLAYEQRALGATIVTICFAGAIGGLVSALQRLRQLGATGDSLTDFHETQSVGYPTIFAAGLIGALFAFVLYLLFAAEVIQGSLFPHIGPTVTKDTPIPPIASFLNDRLPQDPKNLALLFVWTFLAGFSERLVPGNLARLLAKKAELQG